MRFAIIFCLVVAATDATAAPSAQLDARVRAAASALQPKLVAMRRDFYTHPELSNREERTGRVVAEKLRALGLEVRYPVAKHGVIALLRGGKPGPVIALRADMDALPIDDALTTAYRSPVKGVKHACGHDAHTAILLGVAELLAGMKSELPGTVKFLFQPAEESPPHGEEGGAPLMIKDGALADPAPREIYGLHVMPMIPLGKIAVVPGGFMASVERFTINVQGKAAHGALPHEGIDAVVAAAAIVDELQTIRSRRIDPLEPIVLTVGQIHGGTRYNVLADSVTLEGTVRTLDEKTRARVAALMKQIAERVASAHDATAIVDIEQTAKVTYNAPRLVPFVDASLERALGAGSVIRQKPQMVGEDFSYYQDVVPGVFVHLGVGNAARGITAANHTAAFDIDETSLEMGVRALATIALDALSRKQ